MSYRRGSELQKEPPLVVLKGPQGEWEKMLVRMRQNGKREERVLDQPMRRNHSGRCWRASILVAPTNLHLEQSVTGVAAESSCRIHRGYISARK